MCVFGIRYSVPLAYFLLVVAFRRISNEFSPVWGAKISEPKGFAGLEFPSFFVLADGDVIFLSCAVTEPNAMSWMSWHGVHTDGTNE